MTAHIETFLCAAVAEVTALRVVWPEKEITSSGEPGNVIERVRKVLDDEINPAIATHRGRVSLVNVMDGRVQIRLEGGCQGCNLAEVTIRQGIEPLLRARLDDVVTVVDVTDHEAGTEPFFSPSKR
jgi:Fe-S cluster biogenesis protein NfuA